MEVIGHLNQDAPFDAPLPAPLLERQLARRILEADEQGLAGGERHFARHLVAELRRLLAAAIAEAGADAVPTGRYSELLVEARMAAARRRGRAGHALDRQTQALGRRRTLSLALDCFVKERPFFLGLLTSIKNPISKFIIWSISGGMLFQ